jgi:Flp pilus assembly protein TadD
MTWAAGCPWHDALLEQALAHHRAGRLGSAKEIYRRILAGQGDSAAVLHGLGVAEFQSGDLATAIDLITRAVAMEPGNADFRVNLGQALAGAGRYGEAIGEYQWALRLNPAHALACNYLALALLETGDGAGAIAAQRQAVAMRGDDAGLHYNLGLILERLGEFDEAVAVYSRAMELRPQYAEAGANLGTALIARARAGDAEQAVNWLRQSLAWRPNDAAALHNLSIGLFDLGEFEQAIAASRAAIAIDPGEALYRWPMALAMLKRGDLRQGFGEFECRLQSARLQGPPRQYSQSQWDGSDLAGRRILIYAEQGAGDTIHFLRYLPMVAERGGRITLECQRSLVRLLADFASVDRVIAKGEEAREFDLHCPLLSLPLRFGTTLATIPNQVPYLVVSEAYSTPWRGRLGGMKRGLKVGLNWAGNPTVGNDRRRMASLGQFAPLSAIADVTFFSLRKDASGALPSPVTPPAGMNFVDWTAELDDFADTAGLIANLDLVISTDTAVAHLAGAMGKPMWLLLSTSCDWRWFTDGQGSPWYPTMRLFRQDRWGDWAGPIDRVAEALRALGQERAA